MKYKLMEFSTNRFLFRNAHYVYLFISFHSCIQICQRAIHFQNSRKRSKLSYYLNWQSTSFRNNALRFFYMNNYIEMTLQRPTKCHSGWSMMTASGQAATDGATKLPLSQTHVTPRQIQNNTGIR